MKRRLSRILVAALALSLLAACSSVKDTGKSPDGKADNGKSSSAPATTGDPAAVGDPTTNGADEIGVEQIDLSKPIISKQFTHEGKPQHKVTVGILSLERKDKLVILKVVVTPEFADTPADQDVRFNDALGAHPLWWEPTLVDLKNLKRYKVVTGSGFLSYDNGHAPSGQPMYGWAAFAAPPADITKVDVAITTWMPRFTNVPIR